uniref:Uncharacterized protein n=1 Tax=Anguilla anguilla TaxID=7936 RepID=A0A0E9S8A8_ANGAN
MFVTRIYLEFWLWLHCDSKPTGRQLRAPVATQK